jgi:hypothetical protein
VPLGSSLNLEYFGILLKLAQLQSLVAKRLSSVQAYRRGAASLVKSVSELDEALKALHLSIEPKLVLSGPLDFKSMPVDMSLQQTLYLKYFYFNMVLDIHTALTFPWSRSTLGLTEHLALRNQLRKSMNVVAETCRNSILTTQHISFGTSEPVP